VLDAIAAKGKGLMEQIGGAIRRHAGAGAELSGNGAMFFITFRKDGAKTYKDRRRAFYTHCIRRGVFVQPYHHGYIAYRHIETDLSTAARVIDEGLEAVEEHFGPISA
jgi:4-aminobutyrate aminotransferase-like enzyme